jgi:phosphoenolpyruvate-protein phosphotransferase (PTS system enzyme I)
LEQYRLNRRLAEWAAGGPVTIRTLDAGADKPIPGLSLERETSPFLRLRGIRLSLAKPELFRVQLPALCRAAAHGAVEVPLHMVTCQPSSLRDGASSRKSRPNGSTSYPRPRQAGTR